ncbi:flagellar motor protein MotB, partial [Rhodomicrobium udaipurense JA643]
RFGQGTPQGAPGGAQPQGQGPAGKGPAGFGTGAPQLGGGQPPAVGPQFGGGQPPAGGPQFGGRPQFGQPASPQEQRERAERDTRRIEMGRRIEEDQRRQADRERSREGLDERMRLQNERFRDIHAQRHERFDPNGVRFIEEPGNRKIFRLNNQTFIRHDETANFGHFGGRSDRRPIPGGGEFATFHRPDGSRVEVEVDRFGRPIRRVRILPDGRRFTLFENRALAAGLGLAAIGAAIVLLPPPAHAMPPEEYVVDAGVASEETIYDTLYAAPVEPLPRAYSLDEVLASPNLRDRMRSVRLNTIHFEFGSWEVRPDQAPLLQGIADSVNRIVQNNPGEVFLIEGHTDAVGTDEDNLSLSDRRAQAVADVLTQYYQVPRENLVTQGYGEQFLLVPTQGPEIRNRRVVIRRLTPLLQSDQGRYSNSGQGPQNDYRP